MTHQTIGEHDEVLSAEDLAALRENLHEQLLFRREQLRQFATAEPRRRPPVRRGRRETRSASSSPRRPAWCSPTSRQALARDGLRAATASVICAATRWSDRLVVVPQARYCGRCQQAARPTGDHDLAPLRRRAHGTGSRPGAGVPGVALDLGSARTRALGLGGGAWSSTCPR